MISFPQPSPIQNMFPGQSLVRGTDGKWRGSTFDDVAKELSASSPNALPYLAKWLEQKDTKAPRILSVERTCHRVKRLEGSNEEGSKEEESFEAFSSDQASNIMIDTFEFPAYLFTESWFKSNGFAGSMRLSSGGNISWFRVLIKMVERMEKYHWHEMTFFIHQLDGPDNFVTVLCFEIPDDPINNNTNSSMSETDKEGLGIKPFNFLEKLRSELDRSPNRIPDWRCMQSLLLRQAIVVVDRGVWACSKAARKLEKSRPGSKPGLNTSFDFPRAHDLLRHALHNTETLQAASQTLNSWVDNYYAAQKREQRLQSKPQPQSGVQPQPQLQNQLQPSQQSSHDDTPLLPDTYYQELRATLQLLTNLTHRSASNDARIRNEINLAFNVVNQQDTKAMRIVSIVTLTFLPATFVTTMFSMTFFSQPSEQQGWGASSKIWIYFVISVPLTCFTIALWYWGAKIWKRLFGGRKLKMSRTISSA